MTNLVLLLTGFIIGMIFGVAVSAILTICGCGEDDDRIQWKKEWDNDQYKDVRF